jgi:hypothetical protein
MRGEVEQGDRVAAAASTARRSLSSAAHASVPGHPAIASMTNSRELAAPAWSRRERVLFAGTLAIVALLPWTVRRWPSQDGPNHLAVAHVLERYADPGSPFPRYFDVETGFRPSTAIYTLLMFLGHALGLPCAEKLLVSVAIILAPTALVALVQRAVPRRSGNVLLALPFALGWAFAMGFLSFALAMGAGVLTFALGWSPPGEVVDRRALAVRSGLAAVAFFLCVWLHPVCAAIVGLSLLLLEGGALTRASTWARLVVVAGPGTLFLAIAYAAARAPAQTAAVPTETQWANPLQLLGGIVETQIAYSPLELIPRLVALALLARFAWRGIRSRSPLGATAEGALARVVIVLLVLYLVTPVAVHGWFYASTRFLLFASLLLPAVADVPPRVARRLPGIAAALTLAVLAAEVPDVWRTSGQLQDVVDTGAGVARGARLLPMDFAARLMGPQPLAHAWAELVVDRDAVASQLFAAGKPRMGGEAFRTLGFRPGVLDQGTGILPWSTYEGWHDVARKCGSNAVLAWFVAAKADCAALLDERVHVLDRVLDRYDDVLMIDPPPYAQTMLGDRVALVERRGSVLLFRVVR